MRFSCLLLRLTVILAFSLTSAHGLNPGLFMSQYAHDIWTRHDGLPSSGIQCIAQTSDGYIWLGTTAGLVRFDGTTFTQVSTDLNEPLNREPIQALCAGPDNSLWIGTRSNGLRVLKEGMMKRIEMGSAAPNILSISRGKKGEIFFGTDAKLYELMSAGEHRVMPIKRQHISGLSEDSHGRLWIATHGSLETVTNTQSELVLEDPELISTCLLSDSHGAVWVGTSNHVVCYRNKQTEVFAKEIGLLGANILTLYEDSNKDLWIGTTAGLHRFKDGDPSRVDDKDRVSLKHVAAILEDREGSLWVGTDEGLHRFKDVKLVPWTASEGVVGNLTPSVQAMPDGGVYFFSAGDPNGITLLKEGKISRFAPLNDGPSCVGPDGSLWVATTGVILNIKDQQVRRYGVQEAVPPVWISSIIVDGDSLIITPIMGMGVKRWSPGKLEPLLLADGTAFTSTFHVQSSHRLHDGSLAFATYDGLWRLKEGQVIRYTTQVGEESQREWYSKNPQSKSCFHTVILPGMTEYWVTSLAEDSRGVLWLASQRGGLIRLEGNKACNFTTREGLFSNQVYSVLTDDRDDLWMSCPRGVFKVPRNQLNDVAAGRAAKVQCEVFTSDDGMKTDEAMHQYQPAASKAPNGTLWFATKHGVVAVSPRQLQRNTTPPPVIIEGTQIDGTLHPFVNQPTVIPAGSEKVDITFTALSLLVPERVNFKYRLEGYDADWVKGGRERRAHYTRLPPGEYVFRVIASNNDGVWNFIGAGTRLEVRPYFYQTSWFLGACVAGCAGLVYGTHRVRVRQLRIRERELQKRVHKRTAELSEANHSLKREMAERIKAEQEVDRVHKQLMTASHQAGMAEIATGVLHNIGNVLNSVNVSATVMAAALRASKVPSLTKISKLISEHDKDLPRFLTEDPKGRQVAPFMHDLSRHLIAEQARLLEELHGLQENVDHIKDIVAMQQTYASVSGVVDTISPAELVEDALRMHQRSLERHHIKLVRDFEPSIPPVEIEKHKVLQILVNLVQNAKQACDAAACPNPTIQLVLRQSRGMAQITVSDNGTGIPPENMQRIFNHGFTTKKEGHGFGLHSSSLAAKSLGGSLVAESDGLGKGARFILEIPLKPMAITREPEATPRGNPS